MAKTRIKKTPKVAWEYLYPTLEVNLFPNLQLNGLRAVSKKPLFVQETYKTLFNHFHTIYINLTVRHSYYDKCEKVSIRYDDRKTTLKRCPKLNYFLAQFKIAVMMLIQKVGKPLKDVK